jgi:hypothetical protein
MNSSNTAHDRLVTMLETSISALQQQQQQQNDVALQPPKLRPTADHLASMATFVIDSMNRSGRVYHNVNHVFDVASEMTDAVAVLAAVFHDVVYLSIDKELSKQQREILGHDVISCDNETSQLLLAPISKLEIPLDQIVNSIFSYETDSSLDGKSLARPTRVVDIRNECLSAVIAIRMLEPFLTWNDLVRIAACIEASIPFRAMEDRSSVMDSLYARLEATVTKYKEFISMDERELIDTVQMAALFANHDLKAFRALDPQVFVQSSWRLLPEWWPQLTSETCQLQDVLDALLLLQQRYRSMHVPLIFQSFQNKPSMVVMKEWRGRATHNLQVVALVTMVRILALHIIKESFVSEVSNKIGVADSTSPNIPMSFVRHVEEQFDDLVVAAPTCMHSLDLVSQQAHDCLLLKQCSVPQWDAVQCRLSAALLACLSSETIHEHTSQSQLARDQPVLLIHLLPSAVQQELTKTVDGLMTTTIIKQD